ncbi:hypothetical protein [Spiroplasma kunkelii]|nr:hypothetical protein [Spiroplasma kunkelii]
MKVQVMQFTTNETIDLYLTGVDIPVDNITFFIFKIIIKKIDIII